MSINLLDISFLNHGKLTYTFIFVPFRKQIKLIYYPKDISNRKNLNVNHILRRLFKKLNFLIY